MQAQKLSMTDTAESCEVTFLTPHTKTTAGLSEDPRMEADRKPCGCGREVWSINSMDSCGCRDGSRSYWLWTEVATMSVLRARFIFNAGQQPLLLLENQDP